MGSEMCIRDRVGRITVGDHSLVSSASVMLKGATLPDRSILAAHSTTISAADRPGLYAGTPAVWKRELPAGGWFARQDRTMTEHVVQGPMGILASDLHPSRTPGSRSDGAAQNER